MVARLHRESTGAEVLCVHLAGLVPEERLRWVGELIWAFGSGRRNEPTFFQFCRIRSATKPSECNEVELRALSGR